MTCNVHLILGVRPRVFLAALLVGAMVIFNLLAASPPALAGVSGVTVSVTLTTTVLSDDAVYAKARVRGAAIMTTGLTGR
jgi:hypothetical protein